MDPRVEKILNLPTRIRLAILLVLVALIFAGYYFLLFSPNSQEYADLQARHQSLETKLAQDRRIANNLPKFKAEYERMQEQLQLALTALPNKKEIPALLSGISSLAKSQGLDILRFQPREEVPRGFFAEVPVEMKLTGTFHDVVMFFDRVGKMSRIVNVGNLSIGGAKSEKGKNQIQVSCRITTFRFIEDSGQK